MSERRKLLGNSTAMLINRLTQAVASFVLTAAISRTLGAAALGQYILAISYFYLFVNLASQGFKTLFTREISRKPELTPLYLVNGTLLQLGFCLISYLTLVVFIFLLPYNDNTSMVCYIIGFTVIPFGLSNITESILQAQEKMHLIAIATAPIYILRVLAMILVMYFHYGINEIGIIFVISETLILVVEWILILQEITPQWQIDYNFIWENIKASLTFFAIEGIGIVASKIGILLISLLGSELLIGIYGGIGQLLQPFAIISSSISLGVFPNLSKSVDLGKQKQKELAEDILEILIFMALPFCVGISFIGQDLLILIYKDDNFQNVGLILNLVTFTLITSSFSRTFSSLLIANGYEKFNLLEVLITTTVASIVGISLIGQYKLMGAACMDLSMTFSRVGTLGFAVYTRLFSVNLWRIFARPLLISVLITPILIICKFWQFHVLITMTITTVAYIIFSGLIAIKVLGGIEEVKKQIINQKNRNNN